MAKRACKLVVKRGKKIHGRFCERSVAPKTKFDRRSFRTVKSDKSFVITGCPKGKWSPKARRGRGACKVGLRAHKILVPQKRKG